MENELQKFLTTQKLMTLATTGPNGPWISNVYYGYDSTDTSFYFISGLDTRHSVDILKSSTIAFGIASSDETDVTNRKAVQGVGTCEQMMTTDAIATGVRLHNEQFPVFAERITVEYIASRDNESAVWKITPTYMKFWNDELFGNNGTKEWKK
jgi:uncharacterized protein YhbP (UPF0306 family)